MPLALRQTKLAFISTAPVSNVFSALPSNLHLQWSTKKKKLHIKRDLNECFIHQHKSEIPHTESASIDVRTLNRVKDKIFFSAQGRSNSLFVSGDRWAFVERERRGGWWVFRANERGALLKLFSFSFFPLTPLLPFHSFLLTLCSHLCISFFFFSQRDGLNMISRGREYNWPFRRCSPQSHWDSCLSQIRPQLTQAYIHNVQVFSFVFVPVFSAFSSWGKTGKRKRRETEELQALLVRWGCAWVW